MLYVDGGGPSTTQTTGHVRMKGRRGVPAIKPPAAVVNLSDVLKGVLEETGVSVEDIDWVVPASGQCPDSGMQPPRSSGFAPEKVIVTVPHPCQ